MVISGLVRISLTVIKLSRMKFRGIPRHSWPADGMSSLKVCDRDNSWVPNGFPEHDGADVLWKARNHLRKIPHKYYRLRKNQKCWTWWSCFWHLGQGCSRKLLSLHFTGMFYRWQQHSTFCQGLGEEKREFWQSSFSNSWTELLAETKSLDHWHYSSISTVPFGWLVYFPVTGGVTLVPGQGH